jgi:hypothetical protein
VRDQDDVHVSRSIWIHRPDATKMGNVVSKEGIGEDADPVELDEHRRVPDPGQLLHGEMLVL